MLYPVNPKGEVMAISADKGPVEVKRWTAAKKMEVVLRHIRGESLDSLSREIGVPASQIEEWPRRRSEVSKNPSRAAVMNLSKLSWT